MSARGGPCNKMLRLDRVSGRALWKLSPVARIRMTRKRAGWLALAPAALASGVAGFVWLLAARGAFRGAMLFPLIFAGITTALVVVAPFGVRKEERVRFAAAMCAAVVLAWGAAWSHHRFFAAERR